MDCKIPLFFYETQFKENYLFFLWSIPLSEMEE